MVVHVPERGHPTERRGRRHFRRRTASSFAASTKRARPEARSRPRIVRGAELAELMRRPAAIAGIGNREELTPEKEADLYQERRRARAAKRR